MFSLLRGVNQNVQYIDWRRSNLRKVPDEILALKNLKELNLRSNHIRNLPRVSNV